MSTTTALDLPSSVAVSFEGEIATVRLARPEKRNALNDTLVMGLEKIFTSLPDQTQAVIIHGEGDHFSAGLDLSELTIRDMAQSIAHSRSWHRVFEHIEYGKCPVVAVLHGAVIGGGLELASSCHIRVAESSTYYGLPEGTRGIFVGGGGSVRIPRLIGVHRMTDMMLTGRTFNADEGHALGISNYLVAQGEGMAKGLALAKRIASNAPATNFAVTHVLPRIREAGAEAGFMTESLIAAISSTAPEAQERLKAFLEGRAAKIVRQ
jgi:enoyl-CoA hydratase/carnithine racemase